MKTGGSIIYSPLFNLITMAEPSTSSAGIGWLLKTYGFKALGTAAAGALIVAFVPAKTPRENMVRFSSAVFISSLFGGVAVKAIEHYIPWALEGPDDPTRISIYAITGAAVYGVLGFALRALEVGTANPIKIIKAIRGGGSDA